MAELRVGQCVIGKARKPKAESGQPEPLPKRPLKAAPAAMPRMMGTPREIQRTMNAPSIRPSSCIAVTPDV